MSNPNRGKDLELRVKQAFEKLRDVSVDRLHDQTTGYLGSSNICDFIVYKEPNQYYIECKCHYGNTLPFTSITDKQWSGLLEKSEIKGVVAGVVIWFIDHDITIFVPIQTLEELRKKGKKSVNIKDVLADNETYFYIDGIKKRTFFDYDMHNFLMTYGGF